MSNVYIAPVGVDSDGDLTLTFPDELLAAMDWEDGSVIEWIQNDDNTWTLRTWNADSGS
jgi:hypothetical protein